MTETLLLGNPPWAWTSAVVVFVALLAAVTVVRALVRRRLARIAARTSTRVDDALVHAIDGTRLWLLGFVALNIASQPLLLPPLAARLIAALSIIALFVQVGLWGTRLLTFAVERARERALATDARTATSMIALHFIGRVVLWSVLLLVALDNLGVNVTALVAGLGVGGIAIALAVQNVLGDVFASLSILIDKPFEIGDFIVVDDFMGTVEHVGLKTTRIRSLGGEQLVFANGDLLSTRVRNFKRMRERRIVFEFGVLYQTTPEQLEAIPRWVREIIEAEPDARFDRAHFRSFGESAYEFEVVYWMKLPDFNAYMDVQQRINLAIVRRFAADGVEFAYPTRTLFVQRTGAAGNGLDGGDGGR